MYIESGKKCRRRRGCGPAPALPACYDPQDKVKLYGAYNYDAKFDVLRTPMTMKTSDTTLEQFTIGFVNVAGTQATLTLAWEKTIGMVDLELAAGT